MDWDFTPPAFSDLKDHDVTEVNTNLKGKRIGLPDYQMSASMWAKGILQHEFGVRLQDVEWFAGRPDPFIPGQKGTFTPPPGVTLHPEPNDINTLARYRVTGTLESWLTEL